VLPAGYNPIFPQIFSASLVMPELAKTAKLPAVPTFSAVGPTGTTVLVAVGFELLFEFPEVGVLEPHPAIKAAGSNANKIKLIIFFT
jgi:hypothetical protein